MVTQHIIRIVYQTQFNLDDFMLLAAYDVMPFKGLHIYNTYKITIIFKSIVF